MTTNTNREEAIARIMAVAQQLADRDAAAAQRLIDRKRRRKETKKAWWLANPEKAKEAKRKKQAKRDALRKQRLATDPVYAAEVSRKAKERYKARRARMGAEALNAMQNAAVKRRKELDPEAYRAKINEYRKQRRAQQKAEAVKYWLTTEPSGEAGQLVTECNQLITAHNCAFPRIPAHNLEGTP
jgi:hypothetical protein